jgi:hypothetical protein
MPQTKSQRLLAGKTPHVTYLALSGQHTLLSSFSRLSPSCHTDTMAATQCRALAGCRAMAFRPVKTSRPVKVENGSKWFMRRRDSFMVEVTSKP